jgi:hypothetical protein
MWAFAAFFIVVSATLPAQAQTRPTQPPCLNSCAKAETACYRNQCGGYPGTPTYDRECGAKCVATFVDCQKSCKGT